MYFFRYWINDPLLEKIKEEVNEAKDTYDSLVSKEKHNISTCGSKQYDLSPKVASDKLVQTNKTLKEIIKDSLDKEVFYKTAWSVIGTKGGYHTVHNHNNYVNGAFGQTTDKDICTVLYLDVEPEERPWEQGTFFYWKDNTFYEVEPKSGDLLVFPADLYHGTYPQSAETRWTLNIDFGIK